MPHSWVPETPLTQSAAGIAAAPTLFYSWTPKRTDDLDAELFPALPPAMVRSNAELPRHEAEDDDDDEDGERHGPEDAAPVTIGHLREEFVNGLLDLRHRHCGCGRR